MSNKRKLDKAEFSTKESLRKRDRSRPNKTPSEGFDYDDPELHTPPAFPSRPKKDLTELKDWLQEMRQSNKRKDFTPDSEAAKEDLREFLPPSKKRKPFLNSINTSTAFSAKTKITWYDDGSGYIPDTFSEDMFFKQLASAANRGFEIKASRFNARTPRYCAYSPNTYQPHEGTTLLSQNNFDPLRCIKEVVTPNGKTAKLLIKEPKSKHNKTKLVDTPPLSVIQPIPPSLPLDGIIAQHSITADPYWLKLHHSMASPHSDKPFPTLKIGLLNPNGMSSVSRTDQNNNTYQLNKLQVLLQEANTLGLSILGLSETHHFKFPANMREFSSEH